MQRTCKQCRQEFIFSSEDQKLLLKVSPEINGKKFDLPPPSLCFDCNLQQRLSLYNSRKLYRRTCDFSGKNIVSVHHPDKKYTVVAPDIWHGDDWNALDYGRDFDFSRPFFDQFNDLLHDVPLIASAILQGNVNSDFTNDNLRTKNCYLVFDGERAEDCLYGHTYVAIRDSMDFIFLYGSELCYEVVHCTDCYNLQYSQYCTNCSDSWFLQDCVGCKDCYGCANLRQKQFCIFNEQKTEQEFKQFMSTFHSGSYSLLCEAKKKARDFIESQPVQAARGLQNIDSTGDNLHNCKNARRCFDCNDQQDCSENTDCLMPAKDTYRTHVWGDSFELGYNNCVVGNQVQSSICSHYVFIGCNDVHYSQWCRGTKNCFGCVSLKHNQYCILNKQYSKSEYEELVPKIIDHMKSTNEWGEFFPSTMSPFGYNETMAQYFFPLTKQQAAERGFTWSDYQSSIQAEKTIDASRLPDSIQDTPDDILQWAIVCEKSKQPFKIVKKELEFYRKKNLPIPRHHSDVRHADRFALKNPYKLWERVCNNCNTKVSSSVSPTLPTTILCTPCYHQILL